MKTFDIGYIGLGLMGEPMAGHLLSAGHRVHTVKHRSPTPPSLVQKGIILEPDLPTLAKNCSVIFLNVPDSPDVSRVIFGQAESPGLIDSLQAGTIVIDNSTISPQASVEFAKKLAEINVHFADAPVSGGVVGAQSAKLSIMVGADSQLFTRIEPLLKHLGTKITLMGGVGAGQICKAANQIAIAGALAGVAEALTFAKKNGVSPAMVREVLMGGAANSKALEFQGERMVQHDFTTKFSTKLFRKDLNIVQDNARALGLSLPFTALMVQMFQATSANGDDEHDAAAVIRVFERMSGIG